MLRLRLKLSGNSTKTKRSLFKMEINVPNKVFVHCSATKNDLIKIGVKEIDEWHRARGWDGCGYHFVIKRDGPVIESGCAENKIGTHTSGFNKNSLGICFIGTDDFTEMQFTLLGKLYKQIKARWDIPVDRWFAHYQFNIEKSCPNIPIVLLREFLKNYK